MVTAVTGNCSELWLSLHCRVPQLCSLFSVALIATDEIGIGVGNADSDVSSVNYPYKSIISLSFFLMWGIMANPSMFITLKKSLQSFHLNKAENVFAVFYLLYVSGKLNLRKKKGTMFGYQECIKAMTRAWQKVGKIRFKIMLICYWGKSIVTDGSQITKLWENIWSMRWTGYLRKYNPLDVQRRDTLAN